MRGIVERYIKTNFRFVYNLWKIKQIDNKCAYYQTSIVVFLLICQYVVLS